MQAVGVVGFEVNVNEMGSPALFSGETNDHHQQQQHAGSKEQQALARMGGFGVVHAEATGLRRPSNAKTHSSLSASATINPSTSRLLTIKASLRPLRRARKERH